MLDEPSAGLQSGGHRKQRAIRYSSSSFFGSGRQWDGAATLTPGSLASSWNLRLILPVKFWVPLDLAKSCSEPSCPSTQFIYSPAEL